MLTDLLNRLTKRKQESQQRQFHEKAELIRYVADLPAEIGPDQLDEVAATIETALTGLGMTQDELDSSVRHLQQRRQWTEQIEVAAIAKVELVKLEQQCEVLRNEQAEFLREMGSKFEQVHSLIRPLKTKLPIGDEASRQLRATCKNPVILEGIAEVESSRRAPLDRLVWLEQKIMVTRENLHANNKLADRQDIDHLDEVAAVIEEQEAALERYMAEESEKRAELSKLDADLQDLYSQMYTSEF